MKNLEKPSSEIARRYPILHRWLIQAYSRITDKMQPINDLNQTISATPTQSEVQAISDKVDELLGNLRDAGHL
ncbi:MAG: hypothetical protein N0C84_05905 [Candidatus Thiodiazotropha taylori]|uniref:Uncharacterized protein n=1 Tax=Candidatus Thiodiazotropha taylori TaxID=2792791 RepID=A0A9E4KA07_9GAMM|nr:hypothetical protein [Candidatus Thiodiazotropha taylori]MCW4255988.1 hypothetical protein [Candidatus Thiodiazotropha taylori]